MTMEWSSVAGHTQNTDSADPGDGLDCRSEHLGIRKQAAWIIEQVLAAESPEGASVRGQLLRHVAANPGRPEIALAEHLRAIRFLAEAPDVVKAAGVVLSAGAPELRESMAPRIRKVLAGRMLLTAFQPIYEFSTGSILGGEAFTRFVSDGADAAQEWFAAAVDAGLESELEFAALQSALSSAQHLPKDLFVMLHVSPDTCLDPLLRQMLQEAMPALDRVILKLTEPLKPEQTTALVAALAPLRRRGVRLAVGRVGSYCGSIQHIQQLRPDILKLDRGLVAGIDSDDRRDAFGEAITGFAKGLGASLIAEGIETQGELAAIAGFGVTAGQGHYLGRPMVRPLDWTEWNDPVRRSLRDAAPDGAVFSVSRPGWGLVSRDS